MRNSGRRCRRNCCRWRAARVAFSERADRTVVAGQSYGGLAAMYAGLHWPARFGRILSQSGSFWWPNVRLVTHFSEAEEQEMGWLTGQVLAVGCRRAAA